MFINFKLQLAQLLWLVLTITSGTVAYLSTKSPFPDGIGYLNMGIGLLQGRFSSWYFLDEFYPETLRMPGYPLFLGLVSKIFNSVQVVFIIQYILLLLSYYLCLRILTKIIDCQKNQNTAITTFLIFLIISIQLPYYAGQIAPQAISGFLLVVFFYVFSLQINNIISGLIQGLILSGIFQLTPSFLFFPFMVFLVTCWDKERFSSQLSCLLLFIASTLPFGFWNLSNHGVFKITPLEGGAVVAHMGYWQYKLPKNYTESFYHGINTGDDLIYPFRLAPQESELNRIRYEDEGKQIEDGISHLKTEEDIAWIKVMREENPGQFILNSSSYVHARENLLWKYTIKNIKDDPGYYIQTKIYSFFRSYVTGISEEALRNSKSIYQYFNVLYPFFITFSLILLGIFYIFVNLSLKFRKTNTETKLIFLAILYFGLIHTPFTTQGRYTTPIHILVLLLLSIYLSPYIKKLISFK